jgi:hypothetical protein
MLRAMFSSSQMIKLTVQAIQCSVKKPLFNFSGIANLKIFFAKQLPVFLMFCCYLFKKANSAPVKSEQVQRVIDSKKGPLQQGTVKN